jgi:hypothetical protein
MSRFPILFLMVIGICYGDSQNEVFYLAHNKGFSQCYNNILQWANKYKDKNDLALGLVSGSTEMTANSDSGIVKIFIPVPCGASVDPFYAMHPPQYAHLIRSKNYSYKFERYNLALTSRTDSLKIELQFEPGKDYSSCLDTIKGINGKWISIKKEITELISNLLDSNAVIPQTNDSVLVKQELVKLNIPADSTTIPSIKNNTLLPKYDNNSITNKHFTGRTFFGIVTILAGTIAGIVTIVDGNGGDDKTTATTKGSKTTYTTKKVYERWQGRSGVFYTIDLTLSISVIAAGISLLYK